MLTHWHGNPYFKQEKVMKANEPKLLSSSMLPTLMFYDGGSSKEANSKRDAQFVRVSF